MPDNNKKPVGEAVKKSTFTERLTNVYKNQIDSITILNRIIVKLGIPFPKGDDIENANTDDNISDKITDLYNNECDINTLLTAIDESL